MHFRDSLGYIDSDLIRLTSPSTKPVLSRRKHEIAGGRKPVLFISATKVRARSGHYEGLNLYPSPCTVRINFGCLGSASIFCRRLATCTSTVLVKVSAL